MSRAVGIDLGTTYSAVAFLQDSGKLELLPNRDGEEITPSVVLMQSFGQGDEPLVGTMAKHSAASAPDDVVQFVKRYMGDPSWKFVSSSGGTYTPEEISALILKRLKEDAELALGTPVTDAVITVPAYFDDARRTATKHAGKIAGLNVLRVLNEPTAAALAFGVGDDSDGLVLVYDLGGGTFDVTLMRITRGVFDVVGTKGDRELGGYLFDNRLMEYIAEKIEADGGPDLFDDMIQTAEVREKAEMAKRSLTSVAATNVHMTVNGKPYRIPIERAEFERMTADLLNRTVDLSEHVLEIAGVTWQQVDHVLLVGGSTKMPMVREAIEQLAGKPTNRSVHPDHAVALGAAMQAAMEHVATQPSSPGSTPGVELDLFGGKAPVVLDVTSQGLGVITVDARTDVEVNSIIIPANTKIPAKLSDEFGTVVDNQTEINVRVTQGDDTDPDYVAIVGTKTFSLPPHPKGSPIKIEYAYDIDQTIFVDVTDLTTGQSIGTFDLDDRQANMKDDEVAAAAQRILDLPVQ